MFSQKSIGTTPSSTPGLSTAGLTQVDGDDQPVIPGMIAADLMAPDFSYSFLKGLDTISPFRPRTVHIPARDLDAMSNMERQYWEIKGPHFDIVIFFKKGKFYELYDCDAVIANKEFGLKMVSDTTNRGKMRMSGVPEQSFSEWARLFVFRGYKIGRVEQMTADEEGDGEGADGVASPPTKKTGAAAKVKIVPRDLVQIVTSGTISDPAMISSHDALFVLALAPTIREVRRGESVSFQIGIDAVAVDVSRNIVLSCPSFAEEGMAPDVATAHVLDLVQGLFLRLSPKEVIVPSADEVMRGAISGTAALKAAAAKYALAINASHATAGTHAYHCELPAAASSHLPPNAFPTIESLLSKLQRLARNGFAASNNGEGTTYEELSSEALVRHQRAQLKQQQQTLEKDGPADTSAATVAVRNPNAVTPAGAIIGAYFAYLRLTNFDISDPIPFRMHCGGADADTTADASSSSSALSPQLGAAPAQTLSPLAEERRNDGGVFLDAAAIENIELVANLRDGSVKNSIYNHLCRCSTPSGRRLFRSWLLRPLGTAACIRRRQDAVQRGLLDGNLYALWAEVGGHTGTTLGKKRARESTTGIASLLSQGGGGAANESSSSSPSGAPSTFRPKHLFTVDLERQLSRLSALKNENTRVAFVDPLVQYASNLDLILSSIAVFEEVRAFAEAAMSTFGASAAAAVGAAVDGDDLLMSSGGDAAFNASSSSSASSAMPPLLKELLEKMLKVKEPLDVVTAAFDVKKATRDKQVKPQPGMIVAYDDAVAQLKELDQQFSNVLKQYFCPTFGTDDIQYVDVGKDLFLLEIPLAAYAKVEKSLPVGAYTERARTTKVVKLAAQGLAEHVENFKKYTNIKANGLVMVLRHLAGLLCDGFPVFFEAVNAFSYIDCLMSLVTVHQQSLAAGGSCFPTIVDSNCNSSNSGAFIKSADLYHPMIPQPVSNTVDMTPESARVLLLTGPNMGGKSTMMRTIALAFLMAQIGGPVAATNCSLSPVTRIFTRIGARDAQHRGQSTLFVELKEMAEICNYSDGHSLCLVDELGRGTSTHDGYAIAHATLRYLAGANGSSSEGADGTATGTQKPPKRPLVVFSTHYHALAIDVAQQQAGLTAQQQSSSTSSSSEAKGFDHSAIQLAYMDFDLQAVPNPNPSLRGNESGGLLAQQSAENSMSNMLVDGVPTSSVVQRITFLYKMVAGICHRSYGVEVAAVAGIPSAILKVAQQQSQRLAAATTRHQVFAMIQQIARAQPGDTQALLAAARKASVIVAATKAAV